MALFVSGRTTMKANEFDCEHGYESEPEDSDPRSAAPVNEDDDGAEEPEEEPGYGHGV
jgi:hypothetical protein